MHRLIARSLLFGGLVRVDMPTLVARYNAALEPLTGRRTALSEFRIDLSGLSPEIGEEFATPDYLSPNGVNRAFILLGPEQLAAPLLSSAFSGMEPMLRAFLAANERPLAALTAREAVAGEAATPLRAVQAAGDLLALRNFTVTAETPSGRVRDGQALAEAIAAFEASDEQWHDEAAITRITGLAERVGDIRAEPVALTPLAWRQGNFFTAALGGVFVFHQAPYPVLLHRQRELAGLPVPGLEAMSLRDRAAIGHALQVNGLIEPLPPDDATRALLRLRLDLMLAAGLAAEEGPEEELARMARDDLRRVALRRASTLPGAYDLVAAALAAVEAGRRPHVPEFDAPGAFHLWRGVPGPDRDLVNRLLSEYVPEDLRLLWLCNRPGFLAAWRVWPERLRAFAVQFLGEEPAVTDPALRERLFGAAPGGAGPWGRRA